MAEAHTRSLAQSLLAGLLAATACGAVSVAAAVAGDGVPVVAGATTAGSGASVAAVTAEPGAASGLLIHIDPQTGAVLEEPAPGSVPLQLTPGLRDALDTSDRGLVEVPGAAPGAGVRVQLRGRFRNALFATTDASGKLVIQHLHEPAVPGGDR